MFAGRLRATNVFMRSSFACYVRAFSAQARALEKPLPPRTVVPEKDLIESFLKGTGPGGQKINKTSSAVQLKHLPTGIVVKNQETRSREQNRRNARRLLGEKLEEREKGSLARTAIKGEKMRKKKASAAKKSRRKYRQLDEDAAASVNGSENETPRSHAGKDGASTEQPSQGERQHGAESAPTVWSEKKSHDGSGG